MVDAILIIGTDNPSNVHLKDFHLAVGFDPDYQNNVWCPGGPYSTVGNNGVEAWCNLWGEYVSFVRLSTATPV